MVDLSSAHRDRSHGHVDEIPDTVRQECSGYRRGEKVQVEQCEPVASFGAELARESTVVIDGRRCHAVLAICGVFTAIFTRAGGFMRAAAGTATAGTAPATRRSRSGDCACSGERCAYFMVISML